MKNTTVHFPAEWEPADAVLIAWPHENTDWAYMLPEVRACYAEIIKAIIKRAKIIIAAPDMPELGFLAEDERERVIYFPVLTNDTWTRDYGPITTVASDGILHFNDFKFNGWGLKFAADKDNLVTSQLHECGLLDGIRDNRLSFVLEGGSIESDGAGTLLTTADCLLSPNRNGADSEQQIVDYLKDTLGVHTVHMLHYGALEGDDTDGHIDTLVRIAPPGDVIFYTGCSDTGDVRHYKQLHDMFNELQQLRTAAGLPYHLIELPMPEPVYDPEDGHRLPATYANFLILNGAVLLPVYGQPLHDMTATMAIKAAMPDYEVVPIDCSALIRQHGSLHCATMQLPKGSLSL